MKHELTFYSIWSIFTLNTSIHSRADRCNIWKNCAFDDTSLKLCTQSKYTLKNILGYRDIIDLSYEKNGSLFFSKWSPFFKMTAKNQILSIAWCKALELPPPSEWGWKKIDGGWEPYWTTLPEATQVCRELIRCGCKKSCRGRFSITPISWHMSCCVLLKNHTNSIPWLITRVSVKYDEIFHE